jgi:hypothetical protein
MRLYRRNDWTHLVGATVEIHRDGRLVRAGVVDEAMQDNTVLWLAADHRSSRELYESAERYEVWAESEPIKVVDPVFDHREHANE